MVPFEDDVMGFLKQILEALTFIHEKNIAHLDIKVNQACEKKIICEKPRNDKFDFFFLQPQNIVLMGQFPNCEIKLCDLEVARIIQKDEYIREIIGTPDYVGEF